jgi:Cu-Zn family superoxide dismutase
LPVLVIDKTTRQALPMLAPFLTTDELHNKSLILHEGGDNYADFPAKLGGGGARMACGVIH